MKLRRGEEGDTYTSAIVFVNATDADWTCHRYVLCFGSYGGTRLCVWANSLDDALDECVDWIEENAPGLLCDERCEEEYKRCLAEGMSEEEAIEQAEEGITRAGNHGGAILSHEWGVVAENPTRAQILELLGRKAY